MEEEEEGEKRERELQTLVASIAPPPPTADADNCCSLTLFLHQTRLRPRVGMWALLLSVSGCVGYNQLLNNRGLLVLEIGTTEWNHSNETSQPQRIGLGNYF